MGNASLRRIVGTRTPRLPRHDPQTFCGRSLGFRKMLVSTAEIQRAADRFYRSSGFRQVGVEVAQAMTAKQAGGGLTRFYFEKEL